MQHSTRHLAAKAWPALGTVLLGGCLADAPGFSAGTPAPAVPARLEACVEPTVGVSGAGSWGFVEMTASAGLDVPHAYQTPVTTEEPRLINTGVAAGDYDDDCFVDLYLVTGDKTPDALLHNEGDGTFVPVSGIEALAGAQIAGGPAFADFTGDGRLDLFIGAFEDEDNRFLANTGDGFEPWATLRMNGHDTYGAAFADYDNDGDLDVFAAHWATLLGGSNALYLWENTGATFEDRTQEAGLRIQPYVNFVFSPNFTDLDGDGWLDLLITADFGHSTIFRSNGRGGFVRDPQAVLTDENGMGATLGDYDNDGDLDWFVTSIWDPNGVAEANWGVSGNRLYRNTGNGVFEDATDEAGVREGYWGWGTCFADFDNDGWLDLFHTNGYGTPSISAADEFRFDPSRLFVNDGRGAFTEESAARGITDTDQGRGVVCFDADRDGDIDILIVNNEGTPVFYRNDGGSDAHFLTVLLRGPRANSRGVGARVMVTAAGRTQVQEIRAGSHYQSQDPQEAHFGLRGATTVDALTVLWPDGRVDTFEDLAADQILKVVRPEWDEGG